MCMHMYLWWVSCGLTGKGGYNAGPYAAYVEWAGSQYDAAMGPLCVTEPTINVTGVHQNQYFTRFVVHLLT